MLIAIRIAIALFSLNSIAVARDDDPKVEIVKIRLQPVKIEKEDSELRKLQKERFNLSIEVVKGIIPRFYEGTEVCRVFVEAQQRMIAAGLDFETDPKARVALLEEGVRLAKITEVLSKSEFDAGKARDWNVAFASYARADAEIRLLKEKDAKRK